MFLQLGGKYLVVLNRSNIYAHNKPYLTSDTSLSCCPFVFLPVVPDISRKDSQPQRLNALSSLDLHRRVIP